MSNHVRQIYVSGSGLPAWQALLASPKTHWKRGNSAYELAVSWELAALSHESGLPDGVSAILSQSSDLNDARVLFAIPEHKVAPPGTGRASQTDVWALVRVRNGIVSLAVEGKAGEDFDLPISSWLTAGTSDNSPANRKHRLDGICKELCLKTSPPDDLRYQLFHRTYSAVREADRCGAAHSVMIVQSFGNPPNDHFTDFEKFAKFLGVASVRKDRLYTVGQVGSSILHLGWIDCPLAKDDQVARVS